MAHHSRDPSSTSRVPDASAHVGTRRGHWKYGSSHRAIGDFGLRVSDASHTTATPAPAQPTSPHVAKTAESPADSVAIPARLPPLEPAQDRKRAAQQEGQHRRIHGAHRARAWGRGRQCREEGEFHRGGVRRIDAESEGLLLALRQRVPHEFNSRQSAQSRVQQFRDKFCCPSNSCPLQHRI